MPRRQIGYGLKPVKMVDFDSPPSPPRTPGCHAARRLISRRFYLSSFAIIRSDSLRLGAELGASIRPHSPTFSGAEAGIGGNESTACERQALFSVQ